MPNVFMPGTCSEWTSQRLSGSYSAHMNIATENALVPIFVFFLGGEGRNLGL